VVKISARSDEVKGGLYVAQFGALHEKLVLRKTQSKFEQRIFSSRKVASWFSNDSMDRIL
jgi:hypothetical protein